ncbi:MAG TPA: cupredoxin family copper-binding protein [Stellaceae bacterium]|nr:cupredoxin family copper-binding protein [Stellaceae bacterium]
MRKFLVVMTIGLGTASTGVALAHDMAGMTQPSAQIAVVAPNAVTIDKFAFAPQALTVAVGTTVTWTNRDGEPHTVVNADNPRLFKSAALDTGDGFSFTFSKPGTYKYFCSIHPHMTGVVIVK